MYSKGREERLQKRCGSLTVLAEKINNFLSFF
jgi:hypothetical protein